MSDEQKATLINEESVEVNSQADTQLEIEVDAQVDINSIDMKKNPETPLNEETEEDYAK
eukprot:CAMPEP_0116877780 /NCGR_PEP_ID=MMETSP0463-20121206/9526_1 /TAXON_ID=181622 /ORGANISM="Strombidinopsis sp, Strain SopsisLIS2011" /LENGTH=58 /DNA_ID=CAMNT_0004525335 /DNA_START=26 /DNA_END=202 /DNA_ORIENTATION=-